jgi:hypothetical protein
MATPPTNPIGQGEAGQPAMTVPGEIVAYLLAREPVFDRPELIWDEASFDAEIALDFHEITASGQCYEREAIKEIVLGRLAGTHPGSLPEGYRLEHPDLRELTSGLVQVQYTLHAGGRVTRRSTLYRKTTRWQAVFHQGTPVTGAETLPPPLRAESGGRRT